MLRTTSARPRFSGALMSAIVLLALVTSTHALFGLDGSGGTFRYGHVYYRVISDNLVEFTIEAAFTRKVDTAYSYGTAQDGFAQLGDEITMTGRETPEFDFGDNNILRKLKIEITSYSVSENFVFGKLVVPHKYATPNNGGNPWLAKFTGCCRYSKLLNNADNPWELTAQVDLSRASASPKVSLLPIISVPMEPDMVTSKGLPMVTIPATITDAGSLPPNPPKTSAMYWSKATPFDVGNAVKFRKGLSNGFTSLLLTPFFDKNMRLCCTNPSLNNCPDSVVKNPSVSLGCFARLLATDYQSAPVTPGAQTASPAMTVEGWVQINSAEGGVVLSTGRAAGRARCTNLGSCQVALIYVKVNATHVSVGHETYAGRAGNGTGSDLFRLNTVDFAISSNSELLTMLQDKALYPNTYDSTSLKDKWVHLAVVRKSNVGPSHMWTEQQAEYWFATYKVYVNGFMLEVSSYPYCAKGKTCTSGLRFGGYAVRDLVSKGGCYTVKTDITDENGCKVELQVGESNPILGPRRSRIATDAAPLEDDASGFCSLLASQGYCNDNFGNETALIFGGYRGAAGPESYFDGSLDEWRFWNGERSRAEIIGAFKRPITPEQTKNYGDPTFVTSAADGKGTMVLKSNYETVSVLITLFSFDWAKSTARDPDACPAQMVGCEWSSIQPTFPLKPESGKALSDWNLIWTASVDSTTPSVVHSLTDATGLMFYRGGALYEIKNPSQGVVTFQSRPAPGMYQVTVNVAASQYSPFVPVDFIVNIMDSMYQDNQVAYKLKDRNKFPFNDYIPTLAFEAPTEPTSFENEDVVEFVGSKVLPDAPPDITKPDGTCAKAGNCWNLFDSFTYPKKALAYAGFLVEVKIIGTDMQGYAPMVSTFKQVADVRDTKVGFSIGPAPDSMRFTSVKDTSPSEMMMSWIPCPVEFGTTIVCLDAVDYHIKRAVPPNPTLDVLSEPASSNMRCLNFQIVKDPGPSLLVFERGLPVPVFDAASIPKETLVKSIMGRQVIIELIAWDNNCLDEVSIVASKQFPMPMDAVFEMQKNWDGTVNNVQVGKPCTRVKATMRWTPSIQLGGFKNKTCFVAMDTGGSKTCGAASVPQTATQCVNIEVQRCKYALQMDQQLQEVSGLFGVDWMRLWSLNMPIAHPDYVVYDKQVIWVGHLFKVAPNERMDHITQRLGMSMDLLYLLNWDLALASRTTGSTLSPGQELCVVPNSCTGRKDTFYSGMVYKDDKFFVAAKTAPDA